MSKRAVTSHLAGGTGGPFPAAADTGKQMFVSMQLPVDAHDRLVDGPAAQQASRALENIRLHLQVVGLRLADIAQVTLYLTDLADLQPVDAALATAFAAPLPTRTVVVVADLPAGAAVGIEAVAVRY
jgi:enamine deaminase RidA (YjgF/YER057c/UK114 family)